MRAKTHIKNQGEHKDAQEITHFGNGSCSNLFIQRLGA